jgi:hypothetical protein
MVNQKGNGAFGLIMADTSKKKTTSSIASMLMDTKDFDKNGSE